MTITSHIDDIEVELSTNNHKEQFHTYHWNLLRLQAPTMSIPSRHFRQWVHRSIRWHVLAVIPDIQSSLRFVDGGEQLLVGHRALSGWKDQIRRGASAGRGLDGGASPRIHRRRAIVVGSQRQTFGNSWHSTSRWRDLLETIVVAVPDRGNWIVL